MLKGHLDYIFRKFFEGIATAKNIQSDAIFNTQVFECLYKVKSGARKGEQCAVVAGMDGYCKKHTKSTLIAASRAPVVPKLSNNAMVGGTIKAQDTMNQLLNTAVSHVETILTPIEINDKQVYLNDATDLIFDANYNVLGQYQKGGITKIGLFLKNKCEEMCWKFSESIIDPDLA